MSSEHFRPPRRYLGRAASDCSNPYSQDFYKENVNDDDEVDQALDEDQVLRLLLEAFPGVSLENLAAAYARANRDPNGAAEILSIEKSKNWDCSPLTSKSAEKCDPHEPDRLVGEEEFNKNGMFRESVPKAVHSDDFRLERADTNQLKNGHGDFAGASVWRDSPILGGHCRPPDLSSEPFAQLNSPEDLSDDDGYPSLRRNKTFPISNLSASAPVYEYQGGTSNWIAQAGFPVSAGTTTLKHSAFTGSVSSQMQRRPSDISCNGSGSGMSVERETELDDGLYSGKMSKKKKAGSGKADEDKEEFIHAMFGVELGIDVVRDVLDHFAGDSDQAIETLLNIGSTSSGVLCSSDAEKIADPLISLLEYQKGIGLETDKRGASETTAHLEHQDGFVERFLGEEDPLNKDLLIKLCEAFPTVEQSFLAVVLQAAEFSYGGAVDILRESGMTPFGEQNLQPKLDATEVLQALFRTNAEPQEAAGPSNDLAGPSNELPVTTEPWNVVAGRPRIRRNPDVRAAAERLKSSANGEWNEYARQRASANEHWETMKMYMKELVNMPKGLAATAYNQGDRVRANLLSEKGAAFKQLAQEASNRASQNIFNVKNKDIENNITIDLHAQHVMEALKLLKLHLRTLSQVPSVHFLTVITGQGSHSAGGRAKIKPALTRYLDKKKVPWKEVNPGCILVDMFDVRAVDSNQRSSDSSSGNESY